jgi:hypothetical protein
MVSGRPSSGESLTEHVRPDAAQLRLLASETDNAIDSLADHRLPALGYEEPWQIVGASGEVALDRTQLIATWVDVTGRNAWSTKRGSWQ